VRWPAIRNASGPERRTTEMAPVPPGVAGATIVVSSRVIFLFAAASPEAHRSGVKHYAVAVFAASVLRLYMNCCPMARTLFTSQ